MNFLKKIASFGLLLGLLNSPLWCMERPQSIEKHNNLEKDQRFENARLFMLWHKNNLNDDTKGYILQLLSILLVESSLYSNFKFSKKTKMLVKGSIKSQAVSPDARSILFGLTNGKAHLCNIETGKSLKEFQGHNSSVYSVAFSPDGTKIATGPEDGTACVWDIATENLLTRLTAHSDHVWSVAFSPNSTKVITGSAYNTACVWDIATGKLVQELKGHTGGIQSLAVSSDGTKVATGSKDTTACVWDIATGGCIRSFGLLSEVDDVAFSPDGTKIATGSHDGTAQVWNIATGNLIKHLKGGNSCISSITFNSSGTLIATGSNDSGVSLFCAQTGELLRTHKGVDHNYLVPSLVAFNREGTTLVTKGAFRNICLWDLSCDASTEWIVSQANLREICLIYTASEKRRVGESLTLVEGTPEYITFMSMPEHVRKYLKEEYLIKIPSKNSENKNNENSI